MKTALLGLLVVIGLCSGCATTTNKTAARAQIFSVEAKSDAGTFLGQYKAGDKITIQYEHGTWTIDTGLPLLNPDVKELAIEPGCATFYRCGLYESVSNTLQLLTIIPYESARMPFSYTFRSDTKAFLLMNDYFGRYNNDGSVTYRLTKE